MSPQSEPAPTSLSEIELSILKELEQGHKNQGELLDLTARDYSSLAKVLQQLKNKKLIETHFIQSGTIFVLTYCLLKVDSRIQSQ